MQLPESATGTVARTETQTTTETTTSRRNTLSESDPYLIDRLVGYHEYGRALNYLDRLVAKCDSYELAAIEEIVKSEPEFAIYTVTENQTASQEGSREGYARATASVEKDSRKRHGLKWLTALARIELGAMYAGFSQSPRPFSHFATPGYDAKEYKALLAESAKVHFWSLTQDVNFQAMRQKFRANSMTLAYLRRLNIATAFAIASGQTSTRDELANAMEMTQYARRLNEARPAIRLQIEAYLAELQLSTRLQTESSSSQTLTELCNQGACRKFSP